MATKKPPTLTGVYDPALDEPELTPAETAAAIRRAAAAKRALRHYLELVQQIPEVVEVRRSADDLLCTVISADPLDRRARFQVFDAQTALVLAVDDQPFDFRLLNYQALTMQQRDAHIASYGDLVWRRPSDD